jgi:membrane-anchored protein YejM (alkaline phosphatase superfamily)
VNLVLVFLPLLPVAILVRKWWVPLVAAPAVFALLNCCIFTDGIVFNIYRRHIDGVILGIVFAPAAGDVFTVGAWTYVYGVFSYVLIFGAMFAVSLWGLGGLRRRGWALALGTPRRVAAMVGIMFAVMVVDKAVYAWGDIRDERQFTQGQRLFPLYQPVTIKRFARKRLGVDSTPRRGIVLSGGTSLAYPKRELAFRAAAPSPNVVVIVVEGARFDAYDPKVMPFMHAFGERHVSCARHFSGGNNSHYGIFSLMSGLYGPYREITVSEFRRSVMIDALVARGYAFSVLSCTDVKFLEFGKSTFRGLTDAVVDSWDDGGDRTHRDRLMTDRFVSFVSGVEEPFFAFLWYDASHQPYLYPSEHAVFETQMKPAHLNYVKLAGERERPEPFFRRYLNALHYVDAQVARAIGALEERGMLENTLVFVCGDHGEEFNEAGHLGHTSAFTRHQTQTLMVAHIPGAGRRAIGRLTSHLDVVPTIMEAIGCTNAPRDYAQGVPLTRDDGPSYVFVAGWDEGAVVDDRSIAVYGLKPYNAFRSDAYDLEYRPLSDQSNEPVSHRGRLLEVVTALGEFSR